MQPKVAAGATDDTADELLVAGASCDYDPNGIMICSLPTPLLARHICSHLDARDIGRLLQSHPIHFSALREAVRSVKLPLLEEAADDHRSSTVNAGAPRERTIADMIPAPTSATALLCLSRLAERRLFPNLAQARGLLAGETYCRRFLLHARRHSQVVPSIWRVADMPGLCSAAVFSVLRRRWRR